MASLILMLLFKSLIFHSQSNDLEQIMNRHYAAVNQNDRNLLNTLKLSGSYAHYSDLGSYEQKMPQFSGKFDMQIIKDYACYNKVSFIEDKKIIASFESGITGWSAWKREGDDIRKWSFGAADSINLHKWMDLEGQLYDWKRKGHKLNFIGDRKIEMKEYTCLHMTTKVGYELFYYLDPQSHLISHVSYYDEYHDNYLNPCYSFSDYRKIKDIPFPHKILHRASLMGVSTSEKIIEEIYINEKIDMDKLKSMK